MHARTVSSAARGGLFLWFTPVVREHHGCSIECMFAIARAMGVPAYTLAIPGANTTDADMVDLDAIVVGFLKAGIRKRNSILRASTSDVTTQGM